MDPPEDEDILIQERRKRRQQILEKYADASKASTPNTECSNNTPIPDKVSVADQVESKPNLLNNDQEEVPALPVNDNEKMDDGFDMFQDEIMDDKIKRSHVIFLDIHVLDFGLSAYSQGIK